MRIRKRFFTACQLISGGSCARRSGVTFLDLGGRYPNEAFMAVIFSGDAGKFPNVHALEGKTVDITGPVRLYKGKPEIILRDAGQLKAK